MVQRFLRSSPTQKVEGNDLVPMQIGDQPVVDVQVIGESVHEDHRRTSSGIAAGIDRTGSTRDSVLGVRLFMEPTHRQLLLER
jgi:hypothetical protein